MEYLEESKKMTNDIFSAINDSPWKLEKDSDGIKVFSCQSEFPEVGRMYKSTVRIKFPPDVVFAAVNPLKPYRLRWDLILDKLDVVKKIDPNVMIIHHMSRPVFKGLLSARDSYDLTTFGQRDNCVFVMAASVDIPGVTQVHENYTRAIQYPSGFFVYKLPDNPEECDFVTISNLDLSLNPITKYLSDMAKPVLMFGLVDKLRKTLPILNIKVEE